MISAFGIDHGGVSKAMSPNKLRGLQALAAQPEAPALTPQRWKQGYAHAKLAEHEIGRDVSNMMSPNNSQWLRDAGSKNIVHGKNIREVRAGTWEKNLQRKALKDRMKRRRRPLGSSPHDVVGT